MLEFLISVFVLIKVNNFTDFGFLFYYKTFYLLLLFIIYCRCKMLCNRIFLFKRRFFFLLLFSNNLSLVIRHFRRSSLVVLSVNGRITDRIRFDRHYFQLNVMFIKINFLSSVFNFSPSKPVSSYISEK